MVTTLSRSGHPDPPGITVDDGRITESGESPVPGDLERHSAPGARPQHPRRPVGRPLAPRPDSFAPGGNSDAAAWAVRAAVAYRAVGDRGFTPAVVRAWQVFASYAQWDKDETGAWSGLGTWDNIYPSIDTIAREARVSPRSVDRMLDVVRAAGLVRLDGKAPQRAKREHEHVPNRYRLSGTPAAPLPVDVLMARAERTGELFDPTAFEPVDDVQDAADATNALQPPATEDNSVTDPSDSSSCVDFGVGAEQGFGAQPFSSTGEVVVTSLTHLPQVLDESQPSRSAVGVRPPARASSERENRAAVRPPGFAPSDNPRSATKRSGKAPEGHPVPRGELEISIYELTERMTAWQRGKTLERALIIMGLERLSVEQLAYRARANLRMIGGGNRARSPYGFACKGLFRRQYGCADPRCEDGRLFGVPGIEVCPRCAERRRDKAADKKRQAAENAKRIAAGLPPRTPSPHGPAFGPWCGRCDEHTRMQETGSDDRPTPCACRIAPSYQDETSNGSVRA